MTRSRNWLTSWTCRWKTCGRCRRTRAFCYRPLTIRKRGGGQRHLVAPSSPLKHLQRRWLRRYLAQQPLHNAVTAFRPGSSIATHARRHQGQAIILTVDLTDFFPSTAAHRVRRWFAIGLAGRVATTPDAAVRLSRRSTPRGPHQPALSNLVNLPLDERLSELAALGGTRYSRYCDDLAFSWGVETEPPAFRRQVEDALERFGYQINAAKGWRLQRADDRPEITGVVLAGRWLRISAAVQARIRRIRSRWFSRTSKEREQLRGYLGFLRMLK